MGFRRPSRSQSGLHIRALGEGTAAMATRLWGDSFRVVLRMMFRVRRKSRSNWTVLEAYCSRRRRRWEWRSAGPAPEKPRRLASMRRA